MHVQHYVHSSNKLSVYVNLRYCGPIAVLFNTYNIKKSDEQITTEKQTKTEHTTQSSAQCNTVQNAWHVINLATAL